MGITGTDVAKGAADIVLQDDSFTTIEKAIKEGRNIYENIKKSILFAVSANISEVLTMFAAIVCGLPAPLKAVQILWVNLLTDSLPCFALGVDPNSSSDVMNKKPRKAPLSANLRPADSLAQIVSQANVVNAQKTGRADCRPAGTQAKITVECDFCVTNSRFEADRQWFAVCASIVHTRARVHRSA
jgi:magnesium-transporting ATPase (P-type)